MNCISDIVCVIEKCISGVNVDIVVSNVPRKYVILAGYKNYSHKPTLGLGYVKRVSTAFKVQKDGCGVREDATRS